MSDFASLAAVYRQNAAVELERAEAATLTNVRTKHEQAAQNWIAMAKGAERATTRRP